MKIKLIVNRMLQMCPAAWYIFIRTLQLSCLLLFLSLVLLIEYTGNAGGHSLYKLAMALYELPQALLIISMIGSVCVEDLQT